MKWVPLQLVTRLKQGEEIVARVESQTPEGVAWVWVAPYKETSTLSYDSRMRLPPGTLENEPWLYLVRAFEAPKRLLDGSHDLADEELLHDEQHRVATLDEVDDLLGQLVGDPSRFRGRPFGRDDDY